MTINSICTSRLAQLPTELRLQIYEHLGFSITNDVGKEPGIGETSGMTEHPWITIEYHPVVSPKSSSEGFKESYRLLKANHFVASQGFLDRGALSLLRSSKFFFSELCPLLYRKTVFAAPFDTVPLLELAGNSNDNSPRRQAKSGRDCPSSLKYCSISYEYALQNIPSVSLYLPPWSLVGTRHHDAHYITNIFIILRRSLIRTCALLPGLREILIKFPWDSVCLVSSPIRRDFFAALTNIIMAHPKLQYISLFNWHHGLWWQSWRRLCYVFPNQEQGLWDRKRKVYRACDEEGMKIRKRQVEWITTKSLMQHLDLKPWEKISRKDDRKRVRRVIENLKASPFYGGVGLYVD